MVGKFSKFKFITILLAVVLVALYIYIVKSIIYLKTSNNTITNSDYELVEEPLTTHPRLFINNDDINNIKERLSNNYNSLAWDSINEYAEKSLENQTLSNQLLIVQSNALKYLLYGDTSNGNTAIRYYSLLSSYLETLNTVIKNDSYKLANTAGEAMVTGAMVYDWCYNLLSNDEKLQYISLFKTLASFLEIGYPPTLSSTITSHASGNQLLYYLLSVGIATYDEDTEMYDYAISEINDEYIPSRQFLSNALMHYQGSNYGVVRYQSELYTSLLLNKIGYENVFGENHNLIPLQWIYYTRPDGQYLRDGDIYYKAELNQKWTFTSMYLLASYISKNSYIQDRLMSELNYYKDLSIDKVINPVMLVLYLDENTKSTPPDSLPLTKIFGSPIGYMVARTGWDSGIDSSSVVASFKVGEYKTNNHEHLDNGSFQIYYKGALAIDSGIYEGNNGGYGSKHDINYNKRTIAHNSMLVNDPNEEFTAWGNKVVNDGGQQFPNDNGEAKNYSSLLNDGYHVSDIVSYGLGPDENTPIYSYMRGDLTHSYSNKVSNYTRSFLFINNDDTDEPATMIVFDDISSSNENFKKYYLLHSVNKPSVNNNTTTIVMNSNGYKGKLINTTLLPNNLSIETVGGDNNEFNVFGTNFSDSLSNPSIASAYEAGSYRVQISPTDSNKNDIFINVMQVMDSDHEAQITPSYFETDDYYGVNLYNTVAIYIKESSIKNKSYNIDLSNETINSNYNLIVLNLEFDKWKTSSSIFAKRTTLTKENSVLFLENLESSKIEINR